MTVTVVDTSFQADAGGSPTAWREAYHAIHGVRHASATSTLQTSAVLDCEVEIIAALRPSCQERSSSCDLGLS